MARSQSNQLCGYLIPVEGILEQDNRIPYRPRRGEGGVIWIDVFCLNQLDRNRMKTIQRSDEIYYNAKEYHLIKLGSFFRGWVLFELSSAHERIEPKVHHSQSDTTVLDLVKERFKEKGFEGCGFAKASDRALFPKKNIEKYRAIQACFLYCTYKKYC